MEFSEELLADIDADLQKAQETATKIVEKKDELTPTISADTLREHLVLLEECRSNIKSINTLTRIIRSRSRR